VNKRKNYSQNQQEYQKRDSVDNGSDESQDYNDQEVKQPKTTVLMSAIVHDEIDLINNRGVLPKGYMINKTSNPNLRRSPEEQRRSRSQIMNEKSADQSEITP
tara:strand:- start:154 stop:462 length:309 start_codon:yes stop_codon:yes gene_type:complete